jgi:uncharacterized RDD family membrane protein YckC
MIPSLHPVMASAHRFETPENVQVHYEAAGLGSRFVAWFVDQVLLGVITVVCLIALLLIGVSVDTVLVDDEAQNDAERLVAYFAGVMALVWGLGSFVYFGCSELLLRGQTVGKRMSEIRVVKADGFQLDAASILIRNAFRIVDQWPPMWIIPLLSKRGQRAGDMVAKTLVVSSATTELSAVRRQLSERHAGEAVFRFDYTTLKRLAPADFESVEQLLDRYADLSTQEQATLAQTFADRLAQKLNVEPPVPLQRVQFLEDLLAAEFRRQDRNLA